MNQLDCVLMKKFVVQIKRSNSRTPQTNGKVEVFNKTIQALLQAVLNSPPELDKSTAVMSAQAHYKLVRSLFLVTSRRNNYRSVRPNNIKL